jgi:hypothetical protein
MKDKFENKTLGDTRLSAWAISSTACRIQTRDPKIAQAVQRLPDCERVGLGVAGGFFRLFTIRRTLAWVRENLIAKKESLFP